MIAQYSDADPRQALGPDELAAASARAAPAVARPPRMFDGLGLAAGVVGALGMGAATLIALSHDRSAAAAPVTVARVAPTARLTPIVATHTAAAAPALAVAALAANVVDPNQSRAAPMIIDNSLGGDGEATPGRPPPGGAAASPAAAQGSTLLSADEQFSVRVGGDAGPARASGLGAPTTTVMQGTIIPAVLETALNSDLPGYARAIVSRDVRGFDGAKVVIPRGSRLIGQYKSALSSGQSRAFIVWTRLIRPDGVSIALGSPVMDEAGEIGLRGKVNRHYLQRFGAATLLTLVGGAAGALGDGGSTAVVIGAGSEAQSAAAQALQADGKIPPTVRIAQGTPIQVFTARDLDFSGT